MNMQTSHLTSWQLMELISGVPEPAVRASLETHVEACQECQQRVAACKETWEYYGTKQGEREMEAVRKRDLPKALAQAREAFHRAASEQATASAKGKSRSWERITAIAREFKMSADVLHEQVRSLLDSLNIADAVASASGSEEGPHWFASRDGKIRATAGKRLEDGSFRASIETVEEPQAKGRLWGWRLGDRFWPAEFIEALNETGSRVWRASIWLTVEDVPDDGPVPQLVCEDTGDASQS
jgi:hypothetical protein